MLAGSSNFVGKVLLEICELSGPVVPLPVPAHSSERLSLGSLDQPRFDLVGGQRRLKVVLTEPGLIRPVGSELDMMRARLMFSDAEEQVDRFLLPRVYTPKLKRSGTGRNGSCLTE